MLTRATARHRATLKTINGNQTPLRSRGLSGNRCQMVWPPRARARCVGFGQACSPLNLVRYKAAGPRLCDQVRARVRGVGAA